MITTRQESRSHHRQDDIVEFLPGHRVVHLGGLLQRVGNREDIGAHQKDRRRREHCRVDQAGLGFASRIEHRPQTSPRLRPSRILDELRQLVAQNHRARFFDSLAGLAGKFLIAIRLMQRQLQYQLLNTTRAYAPRPIGGERRGEYKLLATCAVHGRTIRIAILPLGFIESRGSTQ